MQVGFVGPDDWYQMVGSLLEAGPAINQPREARSRGLSDTAVRGPVDPRVVLGKEGTRCGTSMSGSGKIKRLNGDSV